MKVLNITYKTFIIIFVVLFTFFFISFCKNKSICGYSFALVNGNSMYPTIYDGDFLVVNQNIDYEINDIICFYNEENKVVVHRIIDKRENEIITKGDFNKDCDRPITKNKIIGKVIYKSTIFGIVFRNLHIIMIVLFVFAYFKLKKIDKYDKIYL